MGFIEESQAQRGLQCDANTPYALPPSPRVVSNLYTCGPDQTHSFGWVEILCIAAYHRHCKESRRAGHSGSVKREPTEHFVLNLSDVRRTTCGAFSMDQPSASMRAPNLPSTMLESAYHAMQIVISIGKVNPFRVVPREALSAWETHASCVVIIEGNIARIIVSLLPKLVLLGVVVTAEHRPRPSNTSLEASRNEISYFGIFSHISTLAQTKFGAPSTFNSIVRLQ